ncbi:hypothetical protein J437_LFUL001118 [Ladona fulva]|uniref:MADF domain-containing protein n=1 Tax=Ladona fulva TaxID=123851 RepID=A0A8K0JWN5_LADFU|nr:hypothetical protein J437_LFUL001118 [Ladona fulva]
MLLLRTRIHSIVFLIVFIPFVYEFGLLKTMDYNTKREWLATDVENLICAYKSRPCLWDINSLDFKDKYAKSKAINELAREFNTSTSEISRKIHNLRNQFNSEMKKTLQRFSGKGTAENNVSKWPHFQALMFLKSSVISREPREPTKNYAGSEVISQLGEEIILEEPNMQNSNEFNPEEMNNIKSEEPVGKSKKRKQTTAIYESDQFDIFGEFVASEIRNLSVEYLKRKMKRRIQQVILEILEEEEMLTNPLASKSAAFTPNQYNS